MLTLLKDIVCPGLPGGGARDILIIGEKIARITRPGAIGPCPLIEETIPCSGLRAFPGLVDQHVHIIGAGGELGFISRTPEIDVEDILDAGVTTVVGLLGADSCTRSLECLYAKAKSLEQQGLSTFIYSGSYSFPAVTFTGDMARDLMLIDKVIGAGEIAISDHRSSQPSKQELMRLASEAHLGGLLSGKAGIVHLHVGDGKAGLGPLLEILEKSDLPKEEFVPTHVNRNPVLFGQAKAYCRSGGNIDLTSGETAGIPVPDAVAELSGEGISLTKVTVSSDSNGSIPEGGSGKIMTLYDDLKACAIRQVLPAEDAFRLASENTAKVLKLYPKKGALQEGSDADILITDSTCTLKMLFCMGKLMREN